MSGLFGSAIIDTAIGLFFLFWLLSIICSAIQEMFAALLKLRAKDLERGIENLVCDPHTYLALMQHPAITSIGNTDAETALVKARAGKAAGRPSYIAARTFSLAFLDSIAPVGDATTLADIRDKARSLIDVADVVAAKASAPPDESQPPLSDVLATISREVQEQLAQLPASGDKASVLRELHTRPSDGIRAALKLDVSNSVRRVVVDVLDEHLKELYVWARLLREDDRVRQVVVAGAEGKKRLGQMLLNFIERDVSPQTQAALVSRLYDYVEQLPPGSVRSAFKQALNGGDFDTLRSVARENLPSSVADQVVAILDTTEGDLSGLRTRVESWFDESMEHVSGVYKRRAKSWILVIGFIVAIVAGADSVRFVTTLYTNPTVRDVVVNEAIKAVATPGVVATPTVPPAQQSPTPAQAGQPAPAATQAPTPPPQTLSPSEAAAILANATPLFGFDDLPRPAWPPTSPDFLVVLKAWLVRLGGCVITAFAISLGAPFWFDVLNKIVNVRSSNKPSSSADTSQ